MADQTIKTVFKVDSKDIKEAGEAYKHLKEKMMGLASEVPGLGAAMAGLEGATAAAKEAMAMFGHPLVAIVAAAGAAAIALAGLGAAMAFKWSEKIDALGDLGAKLGLTADQTYFMKSAMEAAGLSVESLAGGQERLAKAMMKSGDDTKGSGAAFERLGITTTDANGKLRDTGSVLEDLTAKYTNNKGELELNKITTQEMADLQLTLGKNYREVLLAEKERAGAQEMYNEMQEAGIGISTRAKDLASEQEKGNIRIGAVMNQVGGIMMELVLPAFNSLVGWFIKSYKEGGTVAQIFNVIAGTTEVVTALLGGMFTKLGIVTDAFLLLGRTGAGVISGIFKGLQGDFTGGFNQITSTIQSLGTGLSDLGKRYVQSMKEGGMVKALTNAFTKDYVGDAKDGVKAAGDQNDGRKNLRPGGGVGGGVPNPVSGGAAEKKDPIEALIASLQKQLRVADELNIAEQIAIELQDKKYANSSKALKQKAMEIAQDVAYANANKSVQALTDDLVKQTNAVEGLNAVETLAVELKKKKNQGASQEKIAAAQKAAADKDEATATKMVTNAIKEQKKEVDDYVQGLQDEIRAKQITASQMKEEVEIRKMGVKLQKDIEALDEKHIGFEKQKQQLIDNYISQVGRVKVATKNAQAASDDWLGNGVQGYIQSLGSWQNAAEGLVQKGIHGMSEGLVSLFSKGDFSWKEFVASILKGILEMVVQFNIILPLLKEFQSSMGSGESSTGGWLKMIAGAVFGGAAGGEAHPIAMKAQGGEFTAMHSSGVVSAATTGFFGPGQEKATVGEAGDEAIMPLRRNAAGDLGVMISSGESSGGNSNLSIGGITITVQGGKTNDETGAAMHKQMIETMKQIADGRIANAKRPGGMAYGT